MTARPSDLERAFELRNAAVQMTIRYGTSMQRTTYARADGRREAAERHSRACRRQFAAIQRLTAALAELAAGGAR